MTTVFVLISQKIINRFFNIRRPFRALIVVVLPAPLGRAIIQLPFQGVGRKKISFHIN
jgi:hypothetical protein